jgi:hypothetical protein
MNTMSQWLRPRGWGRLVSLAVLAALLVPAGSRAEPPNEPGKAPAPQGAEARKRVKPGNVAVLAIGARFAPAGAGPWGCLLAVRAGAHPVFDAWDLSQWDPENPLATRPARILFGAQTLFLGGFTASPGWPSGLGQLAVLQFGDVLDCWRLTDTDQFRPLPAMLLEKGRIRDGTGLAFGALEIGSYSAIITQAYYTSPLAFRKAARRDLTYAQIFADPATYRGQVVHMEGPLRMLAREEPTLQCRADGVGNLYEAWILNENTQELFCFLSTELPPALAPFLGEDGKKKLKDKTVRVSADGYFYKKFRYKAIDSKANTARDAPVFIGHSLVYTPGSGETPEPDNWGHGIMALFLGIVGFAVVVVIGLTWWFRHSDRQVRGRVLAARDAGFVPPDEASRERQRPEAADADSMSPVADAPGSPESFDPPFGGRLGDFSGPAE